MLLFRLRRSDRTKIEVVFGLLLVLIALGFPMTWWLKILLGFVLAAILVHLSFASLVTIGLTTRSKVGISFVAIAILAGITWTSIREQYLNDRTVDADHASLPSTPTQPLRNLESKTIVDKLTKLSGLITGTAQTNATLRRDTAEVVKQLREFQERVDDWYKGVDKRLNQAVKNAQSEDEARKLSIERAKELSASMADLNRQYNNELKPQVIAIKDRLQSRLPPASFHANPIVDWTLKYGFANVQNAVGNMADYLESLAGELPEK